ncbi:MAG: haloacid dehalogenase [Planctomycetaceae bacterium]|jgi:phosphoglycolate phosphatase-like HAD superfamily hydrolase|nr:haloacid dehalogenase [Planctomycetaceae bacterium]MBP60226.1 haloacid dehalogenase [Planctomycetaceae bacterium]
MPEAASEKRDQIEIVGRNFPSGNFRAAIFDFDGTLSLIRRNWQDVMIPMMVDILTATGTRETRQQLHDHVENYVMRLNGRQTIYQMMQLAEEVEKRGQQPLAAIDYKNQYHDLLWVKVSARIEALQMGQLTQEELTVPGSRPLLSALAQQNLTLYLASGTDLHYVQQEVELLRLSSFFGSRIYGALPDYERFSKAMIVEKIIGRTGVDGDQLVGFGDGFVEIEEVKKVGGLAIGVASDENNRRGINPWKRDRLIRAGADIIIGDYQCCEELLELIGLNQAL